MTAFGCRLLRDWNINVTTEVSSAGKEGLVTESGHMDINNGVSDTFLS